MHKSFFRTCDGRSCCLVSILFLTASRITPRASCFVTTVGLLQIRPHYFLIHKESRRNMSYRGEGGGGRGGGGRGGGRGGGGRGEYYKNKYGRGGGRGGAGRGKSNQSDDNDSGGRFSSAGNNGGTHDSLISLLQSIDNRPYPGYHDIESSQRGWVNERYGYTLFVGRAQSDPFARPTRCRIVVPASVAQFPPVAYQNKIRAVALADFINRAFYEQCKSLGADQSAGGGGGGGGWSGPKGGDVQIVGPNQHVLEHSAVTVRPTDGSIVAQFTVSLPARGRTILGQQAIHIFDSVVTKLVQNSLVYSALDSSKLQHHVLSVEDQDWLRKELSSKDLIAFVPNDAILPRASGADDRPMADQKDTKVIRFQSPPSLEVEFTLPNLKTSVRGMGIAKGVTLICGGGFHGKSTLLSAIQVGVYNKIPGDGREFCVCNDKSVKIRAEDGRAVHSVDISPFITNLPFGKGTHCFTTADASGSTSQASNIVEVRAMLFYSIFV
jgi:predicted ABC-class ATPase